MTIRDLATLKSYFSTGAVPIEQNYADLIDSLFGDQTIGTIIVYHSSNSTTESFSADSTGFEQATTAANDGDVVFIPSKTISGTHILKSGVSYVGLSLNQTILTGKIVLADNVYLENLSILRSSSNEDVRDVIGSSSGVGVLNHCTLVASSDTGKPLCVQQVSTGITKLYYCQVSCIKDGVYINPFGTLVIDPDTTPYEMTMNSRSGLGVQYTNGTFPYFSLASGWIDWDCPETLLSGSLFVHLEGNETDMTMFTGLDDVWTDYGNPSPPIVVEFATSFNHLKFMSNSTENQAVSFKVYPPGSITFGPAGDLIKVYACEMNVPAGFPISGDHAAWQVNDYPAAHSQDLVNPAQTTYHLPEGGSDGKIVGHVAGYPAWVDEDSTSGGHIVQDHNNDAPPESRLDFEGAGVEINDDPDTGRTVISIAGCPITPSTEVVSDATSTDDVVTQLNALLAILRSTGIMGT